MKEFYKKYPSENYRRDISLYLDTLFYFATKAQIPELIREHKHTGLPLDTINLPKVKNINPFFINIPDDVRRRFDYSRQVFASLFLAQEFSVNLRKKNGSDSQLTLDFKLGHYGAENALTMIKAIDMDEQKIYVEIEAANPEINSQGSSDNFISLYDLQNAIMGLHVDGLINVSAILKLHHISILTGYEFSRRTNFDFTSKDVKNMAWTEVYARKIMPEEIK